jgi:hypothetical protein
LPCVLSSPSILRKLHYPCSIPQALPEHNYIPKAAVKILINTDFQLKVLHIAGNDNGVADPEKKKYLRILINNAVVAKWLILGGSR